MKKHKASRQQKKATFKLWSLPAAAMPITVTFAYLFWKGFEINWLYAAGALAVMMLIAYLLGELLSKFHKAIKYNNIGYLLTLILLSIVPALGATYLATGALHWDILFAAAPVGLISEGIIRAKNSRDHITRFSARMYGLEVILPLVFVGVCSIIGFLPLHTIILFMTTPVVIALQKTMLRGVKEGMIPLVDLDTRTATFQMNFTALLTIALVAAKFLF